VQLTIIDGLDFTAPANEIHKQSILLAMSSFIDELLASIPKITEIILMNMIRPDIHNELFEFINPICGNNLDSRLTIIMETVNLAIYSTELMGNTFDTLIRFLNHRYQNDKKKVSRMEIESKEYSGYFIEGLSMLWNHLSTIDISKEYLINSKISIISASLCRKKKKNQC